MTSNETDLVEILNADTDCPVARTESQVCLEKPNMSIVEAGDSTVGSMNLGIGADTAEKLRRQIKDNIDAGERTPVTAAIMDSLGFRDMAENWARDLGD